MRYERQKALKHVGEEGQGKLSDSTAAVVGLGSTGSVAAELLARAGVNLLLFDHDVVEESNLNRQLYSNSDVGKPKAEACKAHLEKVSNVNLEARQMHIAYNSVEEIKADVILDCSDNMQTRFVINDYAKKKRIPWIYSAALETRGMVFVTMQDCPCFNCIFSKARAFEDCETIGIISPASAQVAAIQAAEAIKILIGEEPCRDLISIDVWNNSYERFKVSKDPGCDTCNGNYKHLEKPGEMYSIEFCRSKAAMSAKPQKSIKLDLEKVKKEFDVKADAGIVLVVDVDGEEVIVHDYGELLFKKEKNEDRLKELTNRIYGVAL